MFYILQKQREIGDRREVGIAPTNLWRLPNRNFAAKPGTSPDRKEIQLFRKFRPLVRSWSEKERIFCKLFEISNFFGLVLFHCKQNLARKFCFLILQLFFLLLFLWSFSLPQSIIHDP